MTGPSQGPWGIPPKRVVQDEKSPAKRTLWWWYSSMSGATLQDCGALFAKNLVTCKFDPLTDSLLLCTCPHVEWFTSHDNTAFVWTCCSSNKCTRSEQCISIVSASNVDYCLQNIANSHYLEALIVDFHCNICCLFLWLSWFLLSSQRCAEKFYTPFPASPPPDVAVWHTFWINWMSFVDWALGTNAAHASNITVVCYLEIVRTDRRCSRTEPNLAVSLKCELDRRRHNHMQL